MTAFDTKKLSSLDGFDLRAEAHYDEDWQMPDGDCYSTEARDAFCRQEWGYCGVMIIASRAGIDLGSASIWACEYGDLPGVDHWIDPLDDGRVGSTLDYYGSDLKAEAVADAKAKLAQIVGAK